jgi:hypothetical protein
VLGEASIFIGAIAGLVTAIAATIKAVASVIEAIAKLERARRAPTPKALSKSPDVLG